MTIKVYTADPVTMAEQCRHHAVRSAVTLMHDASPTELAEDRRAAIMLDLNRSIIRCSHLDNRPLDPGRVAARYAAFWRSVIGVSPVDPW